MSEERVEALALALRAEHPDLDPLDLDPEVAALLVVAVGGSGPDTPAVLLAWEGLIP